MGSLTTSDIIQLIIASITLFAVLVALFGERFWRWIEKPRIDISFDKDSDRCFRWADILEDNIQDEGRQRNVRRRYFRLKVTNKGGLAKNLRMRVDLLDVKDREIGRFDPSTLAWIIGEERIDLARGETEYINFLSQVIASSTKINNRLRIELHNANPRGIAWDRPLDEYNYKITIYGDNITPKTLKVKFIPHDDIPGDLRIE